MRNKYAHRAQKIALEALPIRENFSFHFLLQNFVTSGLLRRENVGAFITCLKVHVEHLFLSPEVHWGQGLLPLRTLPDEVSSTKSQIMGTSDSRIFIIK